ncbi:hypothetical protein GWI33_006272 [Rhynchophorus ferrugineus]|uniref:Single domain-containing protein n=1 Tax=Rhynchophorus ferrugineus TaxID=354439 RepID=A0A834MJ31_RHYFE|nr:hypothetical protein GWI33_006272 [Rhynchophorus ferrugineus]
MLWPHVFCWVSIIRRNDTERALLNIPDDKCYDPYHLKGTIPIGERKQIPNRCAIVICGADLNMRVHGCGVKIVKGCQVVPGDPSLPHPTCCHKVICDENKTNNSSETL